MVRKRFGFFAAVFLGFTLAATAIWPAGAALDISLGFGGYAVPERWVPLWIRSERSGGVIEIRRERADGSVISAESYPFDGTNRLESPVLIEPALASIRVRLVSGGREVVEKNIDARAKMFPGHLVLACRVSSEIRRTLALALMPIEPVQVAAVETVDLPSNGLDYDGVGAIVMADPGLGLTPAQTEALRYWLASGGVVAITDRKPPEDSVLSLFGRPGGDSGALVLAVGAGELVSFAAGDAEFSGGANFRDASFWRDLLHLVPYERSYRFQASRVFNPGIFSSDNGARRIVSSGEWVLAAIAASWGVAVFLLRYLVAGKKALAYFAVLTAAALIFAVFAGFRTDRSRFSGVTASVRVVALPGGGGAIVNCGLTLAPSSFLGIPFLRARQWDFRVENGADETGLLQPDAAAVISWRHGSALSDLSPARSAEDRLFLAGFRDAGLFAGSAASPLLGVRVLPEQVRPPVIDPSVTGDVAYVEGKGDLWWSRSGTGWISAPTSPAWLSGDSAWVSSLLSSLPGVGWLVGYAELPALDLRFAGKGRPVCWAIPVTLSAKGSVR